MREILFRGKPIDEETIIGNDFFYGDLCHYANGEVTIRQPETGYVMAVVPETVGQFTGLTDKNGKMIFEGDILNGEIRNNETRDFVVYFLYGGFSIKAPFWAKEKELLNADELILQPLSDAQTASWINSSCEIIGSIHDNP